VTRGKECASVSWSGLLAKMLATNTGSISTPRYAGNSRMGKSEFQFSIQRANSQQVLQSYKIQHHVSRLTFCVKPGTRVFVCRGVVLEQYSEVLGFIQYHGLFSCL